MKKKKWINRQGVEVHPDLVRADDVLRDQLVYEITDAAKEEQKRLQLFKADVLDKINVFISVLREHYNLDATSGTKGNMAFISFDGLRKVQVAIQNTIEFDEKLTFAKEKFDLCLKELSAGATPEMKQFVLKAFEVDKKGTVNTKKVLELKTYDIDHPLWHEAMAIVDESIKISDSKRYIRFYERIDFGEPWVHITLDASKV